MKIVYLGDLVEAFEALSALEGFELTAWIGEEPDREIQSLCLKKNIPQYLARTPSELHHVIASLPPFDLGVIANFGIILQGKTIVIPAQGFVNVHLGLLPQFPGRTPVRDVIAAGASTAGITLHRVIEKVDAGPIIAKKTVAVTDGRRDELFERLIRLVPDILKENLPKEFL